MAVENGLIEGNVEIADLQRLVPVTIGRIVGGQLTDRKTSSDLGVMAGANVGDSVPDNAGGTSWTVISRVDINPMSKFKPVRNSKIEPLTNQEFLLLRYGLRPWATTGSGQSMEIRSFASNDPNPNVAWIYDKPRGSSYDETYRDTDFYHYFHRATPPFAFEVSGSLGSSVGVTFFIDQLAAAIYNSGGDAEGSWHPQYNISLSDLFNGYQTPSNYSHLCVCVHRKIGSNSWTYCGSVVSKMTVGDLHATAVTMIMYAKETTLSGVTYPPVSFLDDLTESGDTFRFIVGLVNFYTGGSAPYEVLNTAFDVYPLAFKPGIDRKDIELYSYLTIHDLKCWFANPNGNLTAEYKGRTQGDRYDKYLITGDLYGRFVTPKDYWAVTGATIKIEMRTQGIVGENDLYTNGVPASLPLPGKPYEQRLVQFGANAKEVYLYIEPAADSRTLEFIGIAEYAYEQVPFQSVFVVNIPKGY